MIVAPGFETDDAAWSWTGLGVRSEDEVFVGSWAAKLRSRFGVGTSESGVEQRFAAISRETRIDAMLNGAEANTGGISASLVVSIHDGVGWSALGTVLPGSGWSLFSGTMPAGTEGLRFYTSYTSGGIGNAYWYVDAISTEGQEMITAAMRSALITDLGSITVANGYQTEVAEVYSEPVALEKCRTPSVVMFPVEGGSSEIETITNTRGATVQNYRLALIVRDDDPNTAVENLLDDVRYAVEKDGSSVSGVTSGGSLVLETGGVSEWTEILTSEDQHNKYGMVECTVSLQYLYSRTAPF